MIKISHMIGKLSINNPFKIVLTALIKFFTSPYFGFIQGHDYFSKSIVKEIRELVGKGNNEIVDYFEEQFSNVIGRGKCVSFSAGRMGFYCLMQEIGIKKGDHVILQSATCSVMVNAVLRIGATPIYSEINDNTFSSTVGDIKKVVTSKTKLIVSQHSFGIPCDIEEIALFSGERGIFLLEDCALTVGSSINGKVCGNFGDAALFSTDHSKPINTISGGMIYTHCMQLYRKLKDRQLLSNRVDGKRQKKIWNQFNIERKYCNPKKYGKLRIVQLIYSNILGVTRGAFTNSDYSSSIEIKNDYPLQLPAFMALIGIQEIKKWPERKQERKKVLEFILREIAPIFGDEFPKVYLDASRDIVPLRFAWSSKKGGSIRRQLSIIIDMDGVWFLKPIVATNEPLINFGYSTGACPKSEKIGLNMVNIPCNISYNSAVSLIASIKKITKE